MADEEISAETEGAEAPQLSETEQRAANMGWTPKGEWRGDPNKWVDAETFIDRPNALRRDVERLQGELSTRDQRITELERGFEAMRKAGSAAVAQAEKRIRAEILAASKEGDDARVQAGMEELDALKAQSEPEKPKADGLPPEETAWMAANPWYGDDVEMTDFAQKAARTVGARGLQGQAFYDAISAKVKEKFPDKFGNPRRQAASVVEAGGTSSKGSGKDFQSLPADIKKVMREQGQAFGFEGDVLKGFLADAAREYYELEGA